MTLNRINAKTKQTEKHMYTPRYISVILMKSKNILGHPEKIGILHRQNKNYWKILIRNYDS